MTTSLTPMISRFSGRRATAGLSADLTLMAGLIGLDVIVRVLPHAPNFTPVAASALFAGSMLRNRGLAILVPLVALAISDVVLGFDSVAMTIAVYALFALPALVAFLPKRLRAPGMFLPLMIGFSLLFFVVSNLVVWAVGGLYPMTAAGLGACFVAALPFLHQMMLGDLFWAAVLFGGASLVQRTPAVARRRA